MLGSIAERLDRAQPLVLLLVRLITGAFLVYGAIDNVVSRARMAEFAAFLESFGFAPALFWAPVSVYAQLICGLALAVGLAARLAGAVIAVNFTVAVVMVDLYGGVRGAFPAAALLMIGLMMLVFGAGRYSLDHRLFRF